MRLIGLQLIYFKGIKSFSLKIDGNNVSIYGDNATGKTTIKDAMHWLLFGKNSENKQDFGIKTRVDGKEIERVGHEVEGTFEVNGKTVVLKKVYHETWTRPKGMLNEICTGNTTDCFINQEPMPMTKYKKYISSLTDEDVFRLLTDPTWFSEKLKWQERRSIITKTCGEVSDEEVINSSEELAGLAKLLNDKSVDSAKKTWKYQALELDKKIKSFPARIDECNRSIVDEGTMTAEIVNSDIDILRAELTAKNDKIANLKANGQKQQLTIEISELKAKFFSDKQVLSNQLLDLRSKAYSDIQEIKNLESDVDREKRSIENTIAYEKKLIEECTAKRDELAKQFNEEKERQFIPGKVETVCPVCGQSLLVGEVENAKVKLAELEAKFNTERAYMLTKLRDKGHANNVVKEGHLASIERHEKELESKKRELSEIDSKLEIAEASLKALPQEPVLTDSLISMSEKIYLLEDKLKEPDKNMEEALALLVKARDEVQLKIDEREKMRAILSKNQAAKKRIADLLKEQKETMKMYEGLQSNIYLVDQFTRVKTQLVNERVSSKFKLARFVMFKENVSNDGIEECCEVMLNGVPYCDLNNAARINVGLDIINTLIDFYGFSAPVIIDNAESVTQFIDVPKAQLIRLVVSEADKELSLESAHRQHVLEFEQKKAEEAAEREKELAEAEEFANENCDDCYRNCYCKRVG